MATSNQAKPAPEPFSEEQLAAFDSAYSRAKDDGSLDRWSYERALNDQLRERLGDKS